MAEAAAASSSNNIGSHPTEGKDPKKPVDYKNGTYTAERGRGERQREEGRTERERKEKEKKGREGHREKRKGEKRAKLASVITCKAVAQLKAEVKKEWGPEQRRCTGLGRKERHSM